jgi:hypothetical protein
MNNTYLRRIYLRLAGAVTLVVMLALLANAFLSHRTFEHALAPQMAAKAASVGASIRALVLKAVENGVGFNELYGVSERFAAVKEEAPEISYISITNASGAVQHESARTPAVAAEHFRTAEVVDLMKTPDAVAPVKRVGDQYIVSLPINSPEQPLGVLHIGVDVRFVDNIVLDMLYDVFVVLVVTLFFTLELLHFMAGAKLEASLKELGGAFERGTQGNFTTRRHRRDDQAFGGLLRMMDATLGRVNLAYTSLARDVEDGRRVPAHERQPGLAAAQAGLQSLAQRYRFGADAQASVRGDDSLLAKIRAPLFMFILAEELTRSFLPGYVKGLLVPIPGISPQMVVGLPIALFMLIVAVGQPSSVCFANVSATAAPCWWVRPSPRWASSPLPWRTTCWTCCSGAACAHWATRWSSSPARPMCWTTPRRPTRRAASRSSWAPSWRPRCAGRRSAASWPTTSACGPPSSSPRCWRQVRSSSSSNCRPAGKPWSGVWPCACPACARSRG